MIEPPSRLRSLSLVSGAEQLCGVEAFARRLAERLIARAPGDHRVARLPTTLTGLISFRRLLAPVDTLIVNLPLVAWKRRLIMPLVALVLARLQRRRVMLILHEWADLDWKRRLVLGAYVPLATRLVFSSPLVRRQFAASPIAHLAVSRRDIVPIPPNMARPAALPRTAIARQLGEAREDGRLVLGHFGSIYPKKQSTLVLGVAAELKRRGVPVLAAFIGDFIGADAAQRSAFTQRIGQLGLESDTLITGYIRADADLFAAFAAVDVFVYLFAEGLTARRGSVLACLSAGRPVVVNAPADPAEFAQHPTYRAEIDGGRLQLAPCDASPSQLVDCILAARAKTSRPAAPLLDFGRSWDDAADVVLGA